MAEEVHLLTCRYIHASKAHAAGRRARLATGPPPHSHARPRVRGPRRRAFGPMIQQSERPSPTSSPSSRPSQDDPLPNHSPPSPPDPSLLIPLALALVHPPVCADLPSPPLPAHLPALIFFTLMCNTYLPSNPPPYQNPTEPATFRQMPCGCSPTGLELELGAGIWYPELGRSGSALGSGLLLLAAHDDKGSGGHRSGG
jgi:hypothetical protein